MPSIHDEPVGTRHVNRAEFTDARALLIDYLLRSPTWNNSYFRITQESLPTASRYRTIRAILEIDERAVTRIPPLSPPF